MIILLRLRHLFVAGYDRLALAEVGCATKPLNNRMERIFQPGKKVFLIMKDQRKIELSVNPLSDLDAENTVSCHFFLTRSINRPCNFKFN